MEDQFSRPAKNIRTAWQSCRNGSGRGEDGVRPAWEGDDEDVPSACVQADDG